MRTLIFNEYILPIICLYFNIITILNAEYFLNCSAKLCPSSMSSYMKIKTLPSHLVCMKQFRTVSWGHVFVWNTVFPGQNIRAGIWAFKKNKCQKCKSTLDYNHRELLKHDSGATERKRERFKGWVKVYADCVTFCSLHSALRHLAALLAGAF